VRELSEELSPVWIKADVIALSFLAARSRADRAAALTERGRGGNGGAASADEVRERVSHAILHIDDYQ